MRVLLTIIALIMASLCAPALADEQTETNAETAAGAENSVTSQDSNKPESSQHSEEPQTAENSQPPENAQSPENSKSPDISETQKPETSTKASTAQRVDDHYFIIVQGKGMPVREISINGINVLGGSVISLSMPIDVTPQIRLGLNEIKLRYVSHDQEALVTLMEKRTPGPIRSEVVKIALPPKHSEGKEMVKDLAFNVDPAPTPPEKIEITPGDEKKIHALIDDYYKALKTKNAAKLRGLYAVALKEEQKIFPEAAEFFTKVLNKEIELMKRKEIKMHDFNSSEIMFEQEGSKIKAVRKDRKAMMESNEIEVDVPSIFSEVKETEPNAKKQKKEPVERTSVKQRLLTTTLMFKKIDGRWHLALPRGV